MALPSESSPLQGGCLCGGVRFEITAPFATAGYCHCTRCQRRTGTAASANGALPSAAFRLLQGAELVRTYTPPAPGAPKSFCSRCGSALFSGRPLEDAHVGVRLGALDADPGIRPQWHQHVQSAASWERLPEDGLPRFEGSRGG